MSDEAKTNPGLKILVERIANKIDNSPVLNGGWEKMCVTIEHIDKRQCRLEEKVDKIHESLYSPSTGLYSRMQGVETMTKQLSEQFALHLASDEKNMKHIDESLKKLTEKDSSLAKEAETTSKLKKIVGEDLQQLEIVFQKKATWKERLGKVYWLVGGAATGTLIKVLVDWIIK